MRFGAFSSVSERLGALPGACAVVVLVQLTLGPHIGRGEKGGGAAGAVRKVDRGWPKS